MPSLGFGSNKSNPIVLLEQFRNANPSNDAGDIKLGELIDAARNEPVTVLENGEPVASCCLHPNSNASETVPPGRNRVGGAAPTAYIESKDGVCHALP
jgi:hypothetical protein